MARYVCMPRAGPRLQRIIDNLLRYVVKTKIHYTSFLVTSPQEVGAGNKSPLCKLCRVVSKIPLQRLKICCQLAADLLPVSLTSPQQVCNKLATSPSTGSYGETCVMDFGYKPSAYHMHDVLYSCLAV